MRRIFLIAPFIILPLLLGALVVSLVSGQPPTVTNNFWRIVGAASTANPVLQVSGSDTNITGDLTAKGTGNVRITSPFVASSTTAPVFTGTQTDYVVFYSAVEICRSDNTAVQMIPTRVAAADWALAITNAAGSTQNIHCTIPSLNRTTASKGYQITGVSISYFISTNALTSQTFNNLSTVTYANNAANVVANLAGAATCALATATQANPYLTACVLPTPAFVNTANIQVAVDWTAVLAALATTYRVYGIAVTYTVALF